MASAIAALNDFGQSPWYDNLARTLLTGGGLQQLIDEDGIKGVTSNPTIFDKAMAAGEGYDAQLKECAEQGLSIEDSYWALVVQDVGNAADLLRPVYDATGGADPPTRPATGSTASCRSRCRPSSRTTPRPRSRRPRSSSRASAVPT